MAWCNVGLVCDPVCMLLDGETKGLLQSIGAGAMAGPAWRATWVVLISTWILFFGLPCVKFCLGLHTCGKRASGMLCQGKILLPLCLSP